MQKVHRISSLTAVILLLAGPCHAGIWDLFGGGSSASAQGSTEVTSTGAGPVASLPGEELWGTDYKAALATAAKENKNVLLDFSGSDWCTACIRLRKTLLSDPVFIDYAKKNLVLVNIDFPQRTSLSPELTKQNNHLQEIYGVDAFPTLVLLTPQEKPLKRVRGLPETDAKGLIDYLNSTAN
jgi:thiol-disulfide isomerase/thioredoxin